MRRHRPPWALRGLLAATVLLASCSLPPSRSSAPPDPARHRVIVLTDIGGNEPDDEQSLIRLLVYANEFDIEGLIANTSVWQPDLVRPDIIRDVLEAYGQVRPNLAVHASGYPSAESLLAVVRTGRVAVGMAGVGAGMTTEASELIVAALERPDPRPVWALLWGGGVDLAQALWDIRENRSEEEARKLVSRLRVYEIAGQDDTGAWATHTFPELFWIRSATQFQGISRRFDNSGQWKEARGGDESVMEPEWVTEHVQSRGPLGALYRHARYKYEGDTPSFLHLLANGLGEPEAVEFGGWGGRFLAERQANLPAVPRVQTQSRYHDYWMYGEATDRWSHESTTYHNQFAPLFRWRRPFQNDFAARMLWSVTAEYGGANHNPIAALDGDASRRVAYRTVRSGDTVTLSGASSSDPDGDGLSFEWAHYREPGSYEGDIALADPSAAQISLVAPPVQAPRTIHILLAVRDDGVPNLDSYKRLVLTVEPR